MTTARDLLTVTMDMPSTQSVERGDLSLALAGAETIDLLRLRAVTLDHDRLVPGAAGAIDDRLLTEAAASLVRQKPYETVEDWLWRRGRGLPTAYLAAFEDEGQLTRQRQRRWLVFGGSRMVLVDSPARRRAAHRWAADEPVLAALAASIGVRGAAPAVDPGTDPEATWPCRLTCLVLAGGADVPDVPDEDASDVLVAVDRAVAELTVERQRRARRRDDARANTLRRGY